jgi:hypothetical protein
MMFTSGDGLWLLRGSSEKSLEGALDPFLAKLTHSLFAMDELIARFGAQIDGLVPLLALSHETIYDTVSEEMTPFYDPAEHSSIVDDFEQHQEQIAHAAFLLGYSYLEAFVIDLIWEVYRRRFDLLSPTAQLEFRIVLSSQSLDDIVEKMIDQTTSSLNSLGKKLRHLESQFGVRRASPTLISEAHVVRNALIHNSGRVNRDPRGSARWRLGDAISLSAAESYEFLLAFKHLGADLFGSIQGLLEGGKHCSREDVPDRRL